MRGMRIELVGDRCVLIRVGKLVDAQTSRTVHAITALLNANKPTGVVEVVPAFNTVAVHFRPAAFARAGELPTAQLTRRIGAMLAKDVPVTPNAGRVVEIPACYGGEFGPDLEDVARQCGLSVDETIALHSGSALTLYAFFFAPGNPFAGPLDARLKVGRRSTPRTRVEAGSVGIANGMSSIYQTASPGGWNLIARTPWNLFDLSHEPPTRLQLGDRLRFKPISPDEFRALEEPRP
jgi:inhibitor of KinA